MSGGAISTASAPPCRRTTSTPPSSPSPAPCCATTAPGRCSTAWPSAPASSAAGRCCAPAIWPRARWTPTGSTCAARFPGTAARMALYERGALDAGAAGRRRCSDIDAERRAHHPSDRRLLHRVLRAGARPATDRAAGPAAGCGAHPHRLHGLLRRRAGAAGGPRRGAGRSGGAGAGGQSGTVLRCICRKPPRSKRCCPSCCSATAPRRRWSRPSRPGSRWGISAAC